MESHGETNGHLRASVQELMVEVAVLKSRLETSKEALTIQSIEYERRLGELNHAHSKAEAVLSHYGSTYLTIDRFERFYNDEHTVWRRSVDDRLSTDKSSNATYTAIIAGIMALIAIGIQAWSAFVK